MRRAVFFVLFFSCLCLVGKGWYVFKKGFKIERICRSFSTECENVGEIDDELRRALGQRYFYLGKGRQCYAFASEDGKYVLKFPRLDHFELRLWARAFPFPSFLQRYKKNQLEDMETRRKFLFESFQIAFHDLKEETGVLYLHLKPTDHLGIKTVLIGSACNSYKVSLDKLSFLLQEKKDLLVPEFISSLRAGDRKRAQEILEAFLKMVASRSEKGIFNKDASFLRNFGFDGNKVVQIDVGSFYRKSKLDRKRFQSAFKETTQHVDQWLGSVDLEMQQWFKTRSEEICASL